MKDFLVAGGSVPGTDHTLPGQPGWKNNQDSFDFYAADDLLVAVVSDGCGSTPYSEIGSRLGAELAVKWFARMFRMVTNVTEQNIAGILGRVQERLVADIAAIASSINRTNNSELSVMSHFFFTLVGVVITKERTIVFSFGDGICAVNGEVKVIPSTPGNAPAYLGQCLVSGCMPEQYLHFTVQALLPTADVDSILIGTDGVSDFIEAEHELLPGKSELMGPISQFWTNEKFVTNPDNIRRRLALVNLETIDESGERPRIKKGLLHDDTTMVVIKRMEGA